MSTLACWSKEGINWTSMVLSLIILVYDGVGYQSASFVRA